MSQSATPTPATMPPREVAARIGCSVRAINRAVARGELAAVRLGGRTYVLRDAVEALLRGETRGEKA